MVVLQPTSKKTKHKATMINGSRTFHFLSVLILAIRMSVRKSLLTLRASLIIVSFTYPNELQLCLTTFLPLGSANPISSVSFCSLSTWHCPGGVRPKGT